MGMRHITTQSSWSKTLPPLVFCGFLLFISTVWAEVSMPGVLSDHMVLQRDEPAPVWGKAQPGETVTVSIGEQSAAGIADDTGRWRVYLSPMPAGGPFTMTVAGSNTLTLEDIYIGEVWLCSGQSNMQWPVSRSADPQAESEAADWPMIRMYEAEHTLSAEEQPDVEGVWRVCSPETVGGFSAVGYYFGRELHRELDVPIGLVHSSWGGSRAEPWTPRQALLTHPLYRSEIEKIDALRAAYFADKDAIDARYAKESEAYQQDLAAFLKHIENGGVGLVESWQAPDHVTDDWSVADVPGPWETHAGKEMAEFNGVAWFRRSVTIPDDWAGRDLRLGLGMIDDTDRTFFDGEQVGQTGFDVPGPHNVVRAYTVPGRLATPGEHTILVRIADAYGRGGLLGAKQYMTLTPVDDGDAQPISLAGEWRYRIDFAIHRSDWPVSPQDPAGAQFKSPSAIYHGMLHPLIPYALRGAIWYQGESNAGEAEAYRELLPLMIRGWREAWGRPDLPFGIVQLANFMKAADEPGDSAWAELRDAQLHTFKTVDHTGLAVTIDIGDPANIHPKNKQEVGRRLALWALSRVYGQDTVWSGPIYRSMRIEGGKVYLTFDHTGGGLQARGGGPLRGFSIAGEGRHFIWAQAEIVGDEVAVWSDQVSDPVAVRYAWADNPDTANLINQQGLPASPFRTDDWMGSTARE
jgi:sialate O-acetylesterase